MTEPCQSDIHVLPVGTSSACVTAGGDVFASAKGRSQPAMSEDTQISGLQKVALNGRARLLNFLSARGAGDDAEDIFQELWQRAGNTPSTPVSNPMSYLFRVAENLIRDVRRSHVSRGRRQLDWHEALITAEEHPHGERILIARQRLELAEQTLEQLGPRVAATFRLYRLEGRTQADIARDLGISLSSVEKDLQKAYRALAQLKAKFDAE